MNLPKNMNAIIVSNYGGPEVLKNQIVPIPQPKTHEILVQIYAAGVSPFDIHVREGWYKNYPLPIILGWEISGIVAAIGENVSHFKVGDPVFAYPNAFSQGGGYAEYAIIQETEAVYKPNSISHSQAAAASMNALTAWQALFDIAQLTAGQKILIHAAAGGIGHLAVQLAKWKGAYVIGTASAHNQKFVLDLGADEVIDYHSAPFENQIKEVDVVLDTIGNETLTRSFSITRKGGLIVSVIDFENIKLASHFGIQGKTLFTTPNFQQLRTIASLLDESKIKPYVSDILSFHQAEKAHRLVQTGHTRGKIILATENDKLAES